MLKDTNLSCKQSAFAHCLNSDATVMLIEFLSKNEITSNSLSNGDRLLAPVLANSIRSRV